MSCSPFNLFIIVCFRVQIPHFRLNLKFFYSLFFMAFAFVFNLSKLYFKVVDTKFLGNCGHIYLIITPIYGNNNSGLH